MLMSELSQSDTGTTGDGISVEPTASFTRLALAVGLISAAVLQLEILLTRFFSVLFLYHYSFFAVSLVMSGLTLGGLFATRLKVQSLSESEFVRALAKSALLFSVGTVLAIGFMVVLPAQDLTETPSLWRIGAQALVFLPGFTAAGFFLAAALARVKSAIGTLYAVDLACAGMGCVASIPLMRVVQGPAAALVPAVCASLAAAALISANSNLRRTASALTLIGFSGIALNLWSGGSFLSLPVTGKPLIERWNEHSRIVVQDDKQGSLFILIDKAAGTFMPMIGSRPKGAPIIAQPWWDKFVFNLAFRLGRPLDEVAIIGVGGGRDLLGPLANGAKHVDGYDLNGVILGLLKGDLREMANFADWPEVSLLHQEGRIGIAHSGKRYDVIQASQIDTWAATAAGGFVLSENGLYTLEAWRGFIKNLSDEGILTMTRWLLPSAPAESHRLTALATRALRDLGIEHPESRIVLAVAGTEEAIRTAPEDHSFLATILVSKKPFTKSEIERLQTLCKEGGFHLLVAPGLPSHDKTFEAILNKKRYDAAIAESPYDLSPPTDDRPYFFLPVRPSRMFSQPDEGPKIIQQITYNAVRIVMLLGGITLALAAAVLVFALLTPGENSTGRAVYRLMSPYFLAIGLGYMFIQIGLHQRLILALGHPTYALSVVLFSMLLAGGAGSYAAKFIRQPFSRSVFVFAIPIFLLFFAAYAPALSMIEGIGSGAARITICAMISAWAGFMLGFPFPWGAELTAPTGESAVQKMWALNGAASIAGSTLAALLSLALGNRALFIAGGACYLVAAVAHAAASRKV